MMLLHALGTSSDLLCLEVQENYKRPICDRGSIFFYQYCDIVSQCASKGFNDMFSHALNTLHHLFNLSSLALRFRACSCFGHSLSTQIRNFSKNMIEKSGGWGVT